MSKDEFLSPRSGTKFSDSGTPSPIPNINVKSDGPEFLSNSLDIKKQLSQSLNANSAGQNHGGISKPQSRRGSLVPIKLNDDYDGNDEDDDDQNNERKRRDNINDRIQQLLSLVPNEFFQQNNNANEDPNRERTQEEEEELAVRNSGTKDGKPNKGQILTKSVEYIQHLQNLIDENNRKEVELLLKLKQLELGQLLQQKPQSQLPIGHTSAERALGQIGVGPLSSDYFKNVLVTSANSNKASQRRGSLS